MLFGMPADLNMFAWIKNPIFNSSPQFRQTRIERVPDLPSNFIFIWSSHQGLNLDYEGISFASLPLDDEKV